MDTIKFETNVPQIIALAFSEGKPVKSDFTGDQLMFSTVDGRRFYTPPIVGEKLREQGVVARQQIELCKKQVGRSIEWQVRTHNAAGAVSETAPVQGQSTSKQLQPQGTSYIEQQRAAIAPRVAAFAAAQAAPAERPISPRAKRMMAAMVDAIDVVLETEKNLEILGRECDVEFESIRAIAATFFIQESKGGAA